MRQGNGENALNVMEEEQMLANWGVVYEVDANGDRQYLDMVDGGIMQALLIAKGVRADGRRAVEANYKVIEAGGEAAGNAIESLYLAANTELNGEIMEGLATAMAAGEMNTPKAQEAIRLARERGLLDKATALEWASAQRENLAKKGSKLIKDTTVKISDFYKDLKAHPEKLKELKSKLLKALLIAPLALLVVAIAAASAAADVAGKALGGGR